MGCGCGSSFSGKTQKKCSCGRNEGGMCQCNQRKLNASGVANNPCPHPCYPCNYGRDCCGITDYGSCSDHSPKQGGGKPPKYLKPYPTIGETYGVRQGGVTTLGEECPDGCSPCLIGGHSCCEGQLGNGGLCQGGAKQGNGGSPKAKSRKDRMMNFHHSKSNFSSKQVGFEDVRSRFNAFMGVTPQPQVDIKKYNIPQDEYYSYNDYYSGMGGAMSGGFKTQWNKNNDLEVEF